MSKAVPRQFRALVDLSVERFDADGRQTIFAVSPFGNSETREDRLARWELAGLYDPECPACQEMRESPTLSWAGPRHKPSRRCESGKHLHCSCEVCF